MEAKNGHFVNIFQKKATSILEKFAAKKKPDFLVIPLFVCNFATDSDSPARVSGSDNIGKRTFTNVIFDVRISQIQDQKRRNRNVHFGCIVPWPLPLWPVSIYLDVGYLEVAYPETRQCESPDVG